jgi:hypothetical protein
VYTLATKYFDEPREKLSSRSLCGRDKTISILQDNLNFTRQSRFRILDIQITISIQFDEFDQGLVKIYFKYRISFKILGTS